MDRDVEGNQDHDPITYIIDDKKYIRASIVINYYPGNNRRVMIVMDVGTLIEEENDGTPCIELIVCRVDIDFQENIANYQIGQYLTKIEFSLPTLLPERQSNSNGGVVYMYQIFIKKIQQYIKQSGVNFPEGLLTFHDLTDSSGNQS